MVRKTGNAIDAAGGLNDRIVGPPVAAGSVLAKTRNRAQNNARVTGAQGRIAEPHFVNCSRRKILHHHVRFFYKLFEQGRTLRVAQIEGDALLIARPVEHHQPDIILRLPGHTRSLRSGKRRAVAVGFTALGRLDFNDVGSQPTEQQGAVGTGQKTGEIQDNQTFEWFHISLPLRIKE